MRHLNSIARLSRTVSERKALLNNLTTEFFRHGKIKTTLAKAKAMVRLVDKLITFAKRGDLHARRIVLTYVKDAVIGKKLFEIIAPRFQTHPGGYTRIIKIGTRMGDAASMAVIELVE